VGQTVKFPCPTKLPEDVDWVRVTSPPMTGQRYIYLGNLGIHYYWRDERFTKSDGNYSHTLTIVNITLNDSAYYRCAEDSGLGRRRFYRLTVEGEFIYLFIMELVRVVRGTKTRSSATAMSTARPSYLVGVGPTS